MAAEKKMLPVEFLTTTSLGEQGELTVPSNQLGALRLEAGASLTVLRLGSGLLILPESALFHQLCDRIAGFFASHGVTEAQLLETLPDARQRVFERHYPALAQAEKIGKSRKKKAA